MPTPSPATAPRSTVSQSADPFAGPAPAATGMGVPRLPGTTHAWTYFVSPEDLSCAYGQVVPNLRRATHKPGIGGNGRALGRGEGYRGAMLGRGYIEVPHSMRVLAWGQERDGYMVPYDTVIDQKGTTKRTWLHAWARPRQVGRTLKYEHDEEGYRDFQRRCLELVAPDGLDPIQVELATYGLVRRCRDLADRDDSKGRRHLVGRLAHLPYEHAPPDLRALMDELNLGPEPTPEPDPEPAPPKGKTTRGRRTRQ